MKNKVKPPLIPTRLYSWLRLVTTTIICALWATAGPTDLLWLRAALPFLPDLPTRWVFSALWLDGLVSVLLQVYDRLAGPERVNRQSQP